MFDMKTLYINQPLREYRLAFDLVANHVNSSTRKSLCLFSSASHAVELLKRCPCTLDMVGIGSFDVCEFVAEVDGWAWDGIQAVELDKLLPSYDKIVWIEPEEFQVESVFHQLRELADKNTKILIINRGPLMNVLPACKVQIQPVERPLSHRNSKCHWMASRIYSGLPRSSVNCLELPSSSKQFGETA
jgi:hypothetical protein